MAERKKLKVILLRHTLSPEETIALSAKLCYSKSTIEDLRDKISRKDQSEFIEKLMNMFNCKRETALIPHCFPTQL